MKRSSNSVEKCNFGSNLMNIVEYPSTTSCCGNENSVEKIVNHATKNILWWTSTIPVLHVWVKTSIVFSASLGSDRRRFEMKWTFLGVWFSISNANSLVRGLNPVKMAPIHNLLNKKLQILRPPPNGDAIAPDILRAGSKGVRVTCCVFKGC